MDGKLAALPLKAKCVVNHGLHQHYANAAIKVVQHQRPVVNISCAIKHERQRHSFTQQLLLLVIILIYYYYLLYI